MDRRFVGKSAIVTGAGSGIGRAVAQRLAAEGATVTCMDLNDSVHATVASIVAEGGTARAGVADVTDFGAVESAVNAAASAQSGIHVVCNVAGIGHFARSEREDPARFARVIAVNLTGSFHVARAALPAMIAGGGGVIVNTASNAGINGQPWSAAYCASKGGVVMMTKSMAYEYQDGNVRVNAVAPGGTLTPIQGSFTVPDGVDARKLMKIMTAMPMASADEMAGVFAFVASDEARYMTGSIVVMDGGLTS